MSASFVLGFSVAVLVTFTVARTIEVARVKPILGDLQPSLLTAAAAVVPLVVLAVLRSNAVAAGNTLLGVGGVVLGFGIGTSRRPYRGVGSITSGIGVGVLGLSALAGDDTLWQANSMWAIGLLGFGVGVVTFGIGVVLEHERIRHGSNVIFGLGVMAMGAGIVVLADPSTTFATSVVVIGVGIVIFGSGLVAAALIFLLWTNSAPGAAVIVAGLGGVVAGAGGTSLGAGRFGDGSDLIASGTVAAGIGAIVLGVGGIVFGVSGLIDDDRLRRLGNRIFGYGGFALGVGIIAAGIGKAVVEIAAPGADTALVSATVGATVGAVVIGVGELFIAGRDLRASSENFQLRPDTFRRRGIRMQGPHG